VHAVGALAGARLGGGQLRDERLLLRRHALLLAGATLERRGEIVRERTRLGLERRHPPRQVASEALLGRALLALRRLLRKGWEGWKVRWERAQGLQRKCGRERGRGASANERVPRRAPAA